MLGGFSESTVWLNRPARFVFSIGYRKSGLGRRLALMLDAPAWPPYHRSRLCRCFLGPRAGYRRRRPIPRAAAAPSIRSSATFPRIYGSEPGPTAGRIGTFVMWRRSRHRSHQLAVPDGAGAHAAALSIAKKIVGVGRRLVAWFHGFAPLGIPCCCWCRS